MLIHVRVIPRSSKNEIAWEGNALKVRLTAPPVDGAANEALLTLLGERLSVPKRTLRIVKGHTGRHKTIEIEGLSSEEVVKRLA